MEEADEDVTKVHVIYEMHKNKFVEGGFHNLLWQSIIRKDRQQNKRIAFFLVPSEQYGIGVAVEHEFGYRPIMAVFKTNDFNEATSTIDILNEDVFGYSKEEAYKILFSTMRDSMAVDFVADPIQRFVKTQNLMR